MRAVSLTFKLCSIAGNFAGIARQACRGLLGRQVQSSVGSAIEFSIYVASCEASRPPVRAKIVGPLELQVVLAAGTGIPLLEPTGLPNRTSQAAEWIVFQVFDRGWKVIGFDRSAVLIFQIDFVTDFQVFPKILRLRVGKVIDDDAVRRICADLIERSRQMVMIRDVENTAWPNDDRLFLIMLHQIFEKIMLRLLLNFIF